MDEASLGTKSESWGRRLRDVIPGGSSTGSKSPRFMPDEPGVIVRGDGCRVWDADGREYIDYRNGLGPVTLGYRFPAVDDAIRRQLENGIVYGHPHPLEGEVAEAVRETIPCAERVRFLKTGGEAIAACIRIARSYTGRDLVVQIGYNGWVNSLSSGGRTDPRRTSVSTPRGVPEALSALHFAAAWGDTEGITELFELHGSQIASLVVAADYVRMAEGDRFYPFLRDLTSRYGSLLVFDEIVTGFRIATAGVGEYFSVVPDLAVFAKGIANGMPLSVYCGRVEVMAVLSSTVVSSTYGGETLSLAAAKATIETYRNEPVIEHIWQKSERLWRGLTEIFERHSVPARTEGLWPCAAIVFDSSAPDGTDERFYRAAYRNGVSLYFISYVTYSHGDSDIDETLDRLDRAVAEM